MTLPEPYYDDGQVTLYCGDCLEILPIIPANSIDFVIVDPPYVGMKGGYRLVNGSVTVGDPWSANLDWIAPAWSASRLGMAVCASYHNVAEIAMAMPVASRVALLTWYKRNSPPAGANVPRFTSEFIWLFKKAPGLVWRKLTDTVLDIPLPSAGVTAQERFVDRFGAALHPTQKPVGLMQMLLRIGGETVLDPFCGTGTTLVAARNFGRRAIGIEIEEKYAEIAVKRLRQSVLPLEGPA